MYAQNRCPVGRPEITSQKKLLCPTIANVCKIKIRSNSKFSVLASYICENQATNHFGMLKSFPKRGINAFLVMNQVALDDNRIKTKKR